MSQAFEQKIVSESTPISGLERLAGAVAHGTVLIIGIPLIAPLLVWLLFTGLGRATPYVRSQAKQAILFQSLLCIVVGLSVAYFAVSNRAVWSLSPFQWADAVSSSPGPALVLLVGMLIALAGSFLEFVAAAQALRGQPYNLPLVGRWIRS